MRAQARGWARQTLLWGLTVGSLVFALGILGTFQYRWLGRVRDAELQERRSELGNRSRAFVRDLERDISRAYRLASPPAEMRAEDPTLGPLLAERLRRMRKAGGPRIEGVYVLDDESGADRLRRLDGTALVDVFPWPEAFEPLRNHLARARLPGQPFAPLVPRLHARGEPMLYVPIPRKAVRIPSTLVIVRYDKQALVNSYFPALAKKNFGETGQWRVRVTGAALTWTWPEKQAPAGAFANKADALRMFRVHFESEELEAELGPRDESVSSTFDTLWYGRSVAHEPLFELRAEAAGEPFERMVDRLRVRNLAVAFGILALFCISIALMAVAFARARRLGIQQRELVASVTHELCTPLAVIRSTAENLRDGVVEADSTKTYGDIIFGEAERLTDLVESALDLAVPGRAPRPLRRAPVDVVGLVDDVVARQTEQAGPVEIVRHVSPAVPLVEGDAEALRRALQNLVGNALKYGGERKWLGVDISSTAESVEIAISDRGMGIARREQLAIFSPFFRGREARQRAIRGTGLGLAIVQRTAEAHGGSVRVHSEVGRGSRFTLVLPTAGLGGAHAIAVAAR